jgi:hypothetical protein
MANISAIGVGGSNSDSGELNIGGSEGDVGELIILN